MPGVLEGVRVVELAQYVFGPSAGAILADWGAEVVKIEDPKVSDPSRRTSVWGVPSEVDGVEPVWELANRGKRGVSLDVSKPEGYDILMRLVDTADVFLTNFLPSTLNRLALDPAVVQQRKPSIVYARGTAHGPRGELASRGGFDTISYWGHSGASVAITPPTVDYPLPMPGPGFGDLQAGAMLAGGICAALLKKERTGEGSLVDVSLLGSGLWAMAMALAGTSVINADGLDPRDRTVATNPLVNVYRTKDDQFVSLVFLQSDRYWPEFCALVDRGDWLADDRFTDSTARAANAKACVAALDGLFRERTLEEWKKLLSEQDGQWDVPLTLGGVRYDEQSLANGYIQEIHHDTGGQVALVTAPAQFDATAPKLRRAPREGEHTAAVLAEVGLSPDEIDRLRETGIIIG